MTQFDPNTGVPPPPTGGSTPPGGPPQGPPTAPPQAPGAPGYPVAPSYGHPQYGYAVPAVTGTNGFAIASLILAFLCSPLGLIFGFIARSQIKRTGEGGAGLALAGIIISIAAIAIGIIYFVLAVTIIGTHINNGYFTIPTPTP